MGIATALIFMAEASAMCGAAAPARVGGGAQFAPAILEFEQEEPQTPTPTVAASQKHGVAPADTPPAKPDPAPATNQCKRGSLAIA